MFYLYNHITSSAKIDANELQSVMMAGCHTFSIKKCWIKESIVEGNLQIRDASNPLFY